MQTHIGQQQQQSVHRSGDPVFKDAGKRPGLWVWRVENFEIKSIPENEYGTFYKGDSYLILKASGTAAPFNCHIHFWLGSATSQDEAGTAALKTVELDDLLGGAAVQHREIQHHESNLFLSYFKKGKITYKDGGIRSGFNEAKNEHKKTLYQVKGRKRPRVFPVPLHCDSLNHGDVFILDNGSKIWIWNGCDANHKEKLKALRIAQEIRDNERAGNAYILIADDDPHHKPKSKDVNDTLSLFFHDLGTYTRIKPASETTSDERMETDMLNKTTLSRVSEANGQMRVTEIAKTNISSKMLEEDGVYILDHAGKHVYIWVGRKERSEEKLQRFKLGVNYCRNKGYPDFTQVEMQNRNFETAAFKQCFGDWPQKEAPNLMEQKTYNVGRGIAKVQQTKIDAAALHQKKMREQAKLFDDGSGKIDVWRVENFKLVPQPGELLGTFYGGDCYVILYTYTKERREHYIIYYWLGNKSTADEKGTAAAMTVKMDDSLGGAAIQIRVTQGKEPPHFLKIFKDQLIIYKGGKASGFRNEQQTRQDSAKTRLFQLRINRTGQSRLMEVDPIAQSLNSNDAFALMAGSTGFLWYGNGSSGDERDRLKELIRRVHPKFMGEFVFNQEGKEDPAFWHILGGKAPYASGRSFQDEYPQHDPRLFLCSNASGRFEIEEVCNFTQHDMETDDVMLLDTYDTIFVWIGKDANEVEKKSALQLVEQYLRSDPSGRDPDAVNGLVIKQGFEPPQMTGHFPSWDHTLFKDVKNYDQLRNELNDENAGITLIQEELSKYSFDKKYPYDVLIREDIPEGVDPTRKEYYLNPEDFQKIFGMSFDDYAEKPQWRKDELKKKNKLF